MTILDILRRRGFDASADGPCWVCSLRRGLTANGPMCEACNADAVEGMRTRGHLDLSWGGPQFAPIDHVRGDQSRNDTYRTED